MQVLQMRVGRDCAYRYEVVGNPGRWRKRVSARSERDFAAADARSPKLREKGPPADVRGRPLQSSSIRKTESDSGSGGRELREKRLHALGARECAGREEDHLGAFLDVDGVCLLYTSDAADE